MHGYNLNWNLETTRKENIKYTAVFERRNLFEQWNCLIIYTTILPLNCTSTHRKLNLTLKHWRMFMLIQLCLFALSDKTNNNTITHDRENSIEWIKLTLQCGCFLINWTKVLWKQGNAFKASLVYIWETVNQTFDDRRKLFGET